MCCGSRHFLRPAQDVHEKYGGKDSWALVTGGSDGIGLEICKQMAQQGFNICIVARNEEKMKLRIPEIEAATTHKIKTRYVVADFSRMATMV